MLTVYEGNRADPVSCCCSSGVTEPPNIHPSSSHKGLKSEPKLSAALVPPPDPGSRPPASRSCSAPVSGGSPTWWPLGTFSLLLHITFFWG